MDFSGLFPAISCLFPVRIWKIYFVPSQSQMEVLRYIHSVWVKNLWFGNKRELVCTIWNISYNFYHKSKNVLIKNALKIRKINKNLNFCVFYLIAPSKNIFLQSEWLVSYFDRNWDAFSVASENDKKCLFLLTLAEKNAEVSITMQIFWWKSKILMIVVVYTKFHAHCTILSLKN